MYARFADMSMIRHRVIRIVVFRLVLNGKMSLMIGNARSVALAKQISKKSNNLFGLDPIFFDNDALFLTMVYRPAKRALILYGSGSCDNSKYEYIKYLD